MMNYYKLYDLTFYKVLSTKKTSQYGTRDKVDFIISFVYFVIRRFAFFVIKGIARKQYNLTDIKFDLAGEILQGLFCKLF